MTWWICHPRTKEPDAMLTLGIYALGIILFKFMFSELSIGPIVMGQLDAGVVAAILTPTLGSYVARKYTDQVSAKNGTDNAK